MNLNPEKLLSIYRQYANAEGKSKKTITSNLEDVSAFLEFLGNPQDIAQVTKEDLVRYILYLRQRPRYATHPTILSHDRLLTDDAVASYVRGIKSFWSFLAREDFIHVNSLDAVKPPKIHEKIVEPLTPGEFTAILKAIPDENKKTHPDQSIFITLFGLGARVSEIVRLPLSCVNFENGQITITGKGGKQRALFMSPTLFKVLFRYRHKIRPDVDKDLFFLMKSGKPVSRFYIEHVLREYALEANTGRRVYPHLLRSSFAIQFLRNGGDPFVLQQILGHSTLEMTRHYVRLASTDVEKSLKKFSPLEQLHNIV